jgi:hypothetical protein
VASGLNPGVPPGTGAGSAGFFNIQDQGDAFFLLPEPAEGVMFCAPVAAMIPRDTTLRYELAFAKDNPQVDVAIYNGTTPMCVGSKARPPTAAQALLNPRFHIRGAGPEDELAPTAMTITLDSYVTTLHGALPSFQGSFAPIAYGKVSYASETWFVIGGNRTVLMGGQAIIAGADGASNLHVAAVDLLDDDSTLVTVYTDLDEIELKMYLPAAGFPDAVADGYAGGVVIANGPAADYAYDSDGLAGAACP